MIMYSLLENTKPSMQPSVRDHRGTGAFYARGIKCLEIIGGGT